MRQAALLKLKRHAEEQIAVAEAKVRGHHICSVVLPYLCVHRLLNWKNCLMPSRRRGKVKESRSSPLKIWRRLPMRKRLMMTTESKTLSKRKH